MSYLHALLDPRTLLGLWFQSLLLTWLVEIPLFVLLARPEVRPRRAAAVGALGSLLTHPLLWFVWPRLFAAGQVTAFVLSGELCAATAEAVLLFALARPLRFWRAVSVSFLANAASYAVGSLVSLPILPGPGG